MGINLLTPTTLQEPSPPFLGSTIDPNLNVPFGYDVEMPQLGDFNPHNLQISPEMLEAFSSLEPIDPTVGIPPFA